MRDSFEGCSRSAAPAVATQATAMIMRIDANRSSVGLEMPRKGSFSGYGMVG